MKKGIKLMFSLHRATGCLVALFFLMWFVTGLVLIYHPYPRLSDTALNKSKENLPDSLPDLQSIEQQAGGALKRLKIREFQGQTLATVSTTDTTFTFCCTDTEASVKPVTFAYVESEARRWVNAPIIRVDTLHERKQWILYSRYDRVMPIYKFYFDDPEKHELFISGKTGEVQQLTDRKQRTWAWFGAIPHKFYLPFIRKNLDLWETSLTIGGLFCFLAAITGLYIGYYVLLQRKRNKNVWESPYRKRWYYFHHVSGLLFGLFLAAWGISGMLSMQRIPQWIINTNGEYIFSSSRMWGKASLSTDAYQLDFKQLKSVYPNLKEISLTHFLDIPAYEIIEGEHEHVIDASSSVVKELFIPESTINEGIRKVHGEDVAFHVELINQYDNYYLSLHNSLPLPVYKVIVDDDIRSRYYIDPESGYIRYFNKNKMARKWLFSGIHYLNIRWLVERPMLWTACIWILCLGGAFVSLTGCWLGIKYLRKSIKF